MCFLSNPFLMGVFPFFLEITRTGASCLQNLSSAIIVIMWLSLRMQQLKRPGQLACINISLASTSQEIVVAVLCSE